MTDPSIENLRRASTAVYLACEESVAADISNLLRWGASEIERLEFELKAARNEIEIADGEIERRSAVTPQDAGVGWQPIWTAPHDGRLALVYRPLAENSGDQPVTVKRLIGGNHHCWESTVPKGDRPTNPTDGACHVTHWMQIPAPPVADRQPENSICKFCARRVFEPCHSVAQAQNACTLSRAGTGDRIMTEFFPTHSYMEEILGNSYRDFHVKGFDYICLRRSPIETIKLYFFEGDVSKLPEIVNPHDHRYNFDTLCVTGAVENHMYAKTDDHRSGEVFQRFAYRTPLNGGNGFTRTGEDRLVRLTRTVYRPGEVYELGHQHVHTIRMHENETVIALRQFEDRVALHVPTSTWMRDREPPDLAGLYRQFKADEVRKRLATLRERAPNIRLPEVV